MTRKLIQTATKPASRSGHGSTDLLRPNDVRTWANPDVLFQVSVESIGDFSKAEILDDPKSLVTQHLGQLGRIEKTEPWLTQRSRPCGHGHHMSAAIGWLVFKRLGVVEHDLRIRHTGDEIQRRGDRLACEIRHDTEPLEERRAISLKPGGRQTIGQALPLEVDGSEGERRGHGETGLLQALALQALRCRIIDLEHTDTLPGMRVAQRKRIEA